MFQNYFIKQAFLAVFSALIIVVLLSSFPSMKEISQPIWYVFIFINALFAVLYVIGNESLKAKSHKDFVTIFGVLFSVKVGVTLAWMVVSIFLLQLTNKAYILTFFALYLSYTFLFAWQLFSQTKKQK